MPKVISLPMRVVELPKSTCDIFVLNKHYSRRAPFFTKGFGLVIAGKIEGVCVYGQTSAPMAKYGFKDRDYPLMELVRLVIQTNRKNAASFLVGNSLQNLPKPCAVVSYADTEMGHAGIVYQSTNWIYTGLTGASGYNYIVDGVKTHPKTLFNRGFRNLKQWAEENGVDTVETSWKHRYFFFVGSKSDRKRMRASLKYPEVKPYPKLPKAEYDAGERIEMIYGNKSLWAELAKFQ